MKNCRTTTEVETLRVNLHCEQIKVDEIPFVLFRLKTIQFHQVEDCFHVDHCLKASSLRE